MRAAGEKVSLRKRLSVLQIKKVAFGYNYKCATCRCTLPPTVQMDHIVPLWHPKWTRMIAQFGTQSAREKANDLSNIQPLCPNCHASKSLRESESYTRLQRLRTCHAREQECPSCNRVHSKYFSVPEGCVEKSILSCSTKYLKRD